ncbi:MULTISPECIES: hypothetical protein [Salinibaculum]|uniref:hypothetical protein n=1 Tax=Salinibaculum TaxID=2732368 RepID=UPI0030D1D238
MSPDERRHSDRHGGTVDRRSVLAALAGVTVGSVAGCSSDTDQDSQGDDPGTTSDGGKSDPSPETTEETATTEETGEPTETTEELPTVPFPKSVYEFTEGESYTYDFNYVGTVSEQTWEVIGVDGDQVTVKHTITEDGESTTKEVTGSSKYVYQNVMMDAGPMFIIVRNAQLYSKADPFAPNTTFRVDVSDQQKQWEAEIVEVGSETTVNGIPCTEFTVIPDKEYASYKYTICTADGYPFTISYKAENTNSNTVRMEGTLTEANRP